MMLATEDAGRVRVVSRLRGWVEGEPGAAMVPERRELLSALSCIHHHALTRPEFVGIIKALRRHVLYARNRDGGL
jgi:hypothetical protein